MKQIRRACGKGRLLSIPFSSVHMCLPGVACVQLHLQGPPPVIGHLLSVVGQR